MSKIGKLGCPGIDILEGTRVQRCLLFCLCICLSVCVGYVNLECHSILVFETGSLTGLELA